MNSLEAGKRSVKLWLAVRLFQLTILGLSVTGIGYFIYLIAKLSGY